MSNELGPDRGLFDEGKSRLENDFQLEPSAWVFNANDLPSANRTLVAHAHSILRINQNWDIVAIKQGRATTSDATSITVVLNSPNSPFGNLAHLADPSSLKLGGILRNILREPELRHHPTQGYPYLELGNLPIPPFLNNDKVATPLTQRTERLYVQGVEVHPYLLDIHGQLFAVTSRIALVISFGDLIDDQNNLILTLLSNPHSKEFQQAIADLEALRTKLTANQHITA